MAVKVIAYKMVQSRLFFIHIRDQEKWHYLYRDKEIANYLNMSIEEYRQGLRQYGDLEVDDDSRIYFPSRKACQVAIDEFVVPRLTMKLIANL